MQIHEAYEILTTYQAWRKGAEIPMLEAKVISEAIDTILKNRPHQPKIPAGKTSQLPGINVNEVKPSNPQMVKENFSPRVDNQRMYSEEDLREAFKQSRQAKIFEKDMPPVYGSFEEWFEKFKKK